MQGTLYKARVLSSDFCGNINTALERRDLIVLYDTICVLLDPSVFYGNGAARSTYLCVHAMPKHKAEELERRCTWSSSDEKTYLKEIRTIKICGLPYLDFPPPLPLPYFLVPSRTPAC